MNQEFSSPLENKDIDFGQIFKLILSHWWVIVLCLIIGIISANLYNRYTIPIYSSTGTIIVKDESSTTLGADAAQLQEWDILHLTKNLTTEIEIIKSQSVIEKSVALMDFVDVSYFAMGRFKTTELYKNTPFIVKIDTFYAREQNFNIQFLDTARFKFSYQRGEEEISSLHRINEKINNQFGIFSITKNTQRPSNPNLNEPYSFIVHYPWTPIGKFRGSVGISRGNEATSMLYISCQDNVPERAMDFVNALIKAYQERSVEEKTKVAKNTLKFIGELLAAYRDSLNSSEQQIERFQRSKGIINLSPDFSQSRLVRYIDQKANMELELRALDSLEASVRKGKDPSLISTTNMGTGDSRFASSLSQINQLQIKRNTMQTSLTPNNPDLKRIDRQLELARKNLFTTLQSYKDALGNNLRTINQEIRKYETELDKIPSTQRENTGIRRRYEIHAANYQSLLAKRESYSIAEAATLSDVVVLDYAYLPGSPIRPKPNSAYVTAIFISLATAATFIIIKILLKDTITDRSEVEKNTRVPILGIVSHSPRPGKSNLVVIDRPKSIISESFRSIRTNLQYLASQSEHKVVLVSSTISGEGKTFFTLNIGSILALSDKKVLMVGLDLRKPKLQLEFNLPGDKGITQVLIGKLKWQDAIVHTPVNNLHLLPAGAIPPNPSELIMSPAMEQLMEDLRNEYDYILIDTPPVGLVTDAVIAMKFADVNIYLVRQKKSKKIFLETINKLYQEKTAKNLAIVLNDFRTSSGYGYNYGYGYGYGYGYYDEDTSKKTLLKRIFIRLGSPFQWIRRRFDSQ
ncbi:polysaccharide biosynthesis tyrosine autokinase [Cytophagaceae bacterium DM2B3-1]|uniref:non-specific protein-tyrosine kinase n=1 Tax=Xanthocytophaga flava TaxID=3048013 RepID=A0ABT7CUX2_9BACT|nr:polysaccharide biosynthesis tyrosine autokinase [Xanthocytophaga flavus]MDJ1469216.1 polysaccharide biosynthesis tyrosine autokinase [Xanthocytophaga flavus]MDJ1497528.1 polysaccharide biosynthesis tyrosine autokinase [Xanthocytophaga flavus]